MTLLAGLPENWHYKPQMICLPAPLEEAP